MTTMQGVSTLEVAGCPACGTLYAAPKALMDQRRNEAGNVWCPNGHKLGWKDTEADILRRRLASATQDVAFYKERTAETEGVWRLTLVLSRVDGSVYRARRIFGRTSAQADHLSEPVHVGKVAEVATEAIIRKAAVMPPKEKWVR